MCVCVRGGEREREREERERDRERDTERERERERERKRALSMFRMAMQGEKPNTVCQLLRQIYLPCLPNFLKKEIARRISPARLKSAVHDVRNLTLYHTIPTFDDPEEEAF